MAVTSDKPAPYAPPSAIIELIDRYRNRGLPSPVTAEVLGRVGISESLIPRTLQAMQTLDLINEDGTPTENFEKIRLAPEAEYKVRLEDWLNGVYGDIILIVDPANDDEVAVRDAFRSYNPVGQQSRMVTLFLGLYSAAGVIPEKKPQPRRPRITGIQQAKRSKPKHSAKLNPSVSSNIPQPLAGLLSSLPFDGQGWTQDRRDKFMNTFGAVLDFCFPIAESDAPDPKLETEEEAES